MDEATHKKRARRGVRLLLDEMYTGFKEYLESMGWEVVTVEEAGLRGARDFEVVDYAKRRGLVVVTQDQKTAELAQLRGVGCIHISSLMIAKLIDAELRKRKLGRLKTRS
jgi:predicted nuclease of predicted toxin-antitoxin system